MKIKKNIKEELIKEEKNYLQEKTVTLDESIRFKALYKCKAVFCRYFSNGQYIVFGDLNSCDYALRKGYAKDYEKYVDMIFFRSLDEDKFQYEKEKLYDEFIKKCNDSQCHYDTFYYEYDKLLFDEQLERLYGKAVTGRILEKRRRFYNK